MLTRIRTGYSFREAVGKLDDVLDALDKWDSVYRPITDRASNYGWFDWVKKCESRNKVPVLGVELEVTPNLTEKKPVSDLWTFYPYSNLKEINRLISLAYSQFRYRPLLTYEQALEAKCYKIIGHRSIPEFLRDCLVLYGNDEVYLGLSPSVTRYYFKQTRGLEIPYVISGDNLYPTKENQSLYQIICGKGGRGGGLQTYPQHILTRNEYFSYIGKKHEITGSEIAGFIANSIDILKQASKVSLSKASLPQYESFLSLKEKCRRRAKQYYNIDIIDIKNKKYLDRLIHELEIITNKGFDSYFHIVGDITDYARKKMIVGPGRGSAAGSLVCYLMGITTIDPIKHNLSFERFIDIYREDLPDIDIDFPPNKRTDIIRYIKKTFNKKKCVQVGTVNNYQAAQSIRETCASLNIKPWELGRLRRIEKGDELIEALEDAEDILDEHPEISILGNIANHPRHMGKHAGAVVLANEEIMSIVPLNLRDKNNPVAMVDKDSAEKLGLLKIDILGLNTLDILKETLDLAGVDFNLLNKVPLNYKPAYEIIRNKKYTGIFQFEGDTVLGVANQIYVSEFNDLCVITSVGRTGPLAVGDADTWVRRRNGTEDIEYAHEAFEPILKETLGVIVYQEQLMRILREIGGLEWKNIMILRKAINKKDTSIFEPYREEFIDGCNTQRVSADIANETYDKLTSHGQYSFNKSHAVAYSTISYWCMVLKARFPLEFTAATLSFAEGSTKEKKLLKQRSLLREAGELGVKYKPYDIDISDDKWKISGDTLIGPLSNIKGIGPKRVKSILHHRRSNKVLPSSLMKVLSRASTDIDSIYPVKDSLDILCGEQGLEKFNINTRAYTIEDIESINIAPNEEICLVCFIDKVKIKQDQKGKPRLVLHVHDDTGKLYVTVNSYYYKRVNNTINKYNLKDIATKKQNLYALKGAVYNVSSDKKLLGAIAARYIGTGIS